MPQSLSRFIMAWVAVAWLVPVQGRAQADLDSLDVWMRRMHPAPFLRCTPSEWESKLDILKSEWKDMSHMEHVREVNALLQTLQDSHAAVSAWCWTCAVEREHGRVPIRWGSTRGLALARTGHSRLHHPGHANGFHRLTVVCFIVCKPIG